MTRVPSRPAARPVLRSRPDVPHVPDAIEIPADLERLLSVDQLRRWLLAYHKNRLTDSYGIEWKAYIKPGDLPQAPAVPIRVKAAPFTSRSMRLCRENLGGLDNVLALLSKLRGRGASLRLALAQLTRIVRRKQREASDV